MTTILIRTIFLLTIVSISLSADETDSTTNTTLRPKDLSGTWSGQLSINDKQAIEMLVKFPGSDRAMDPEQIWIRQRAPGKTITGQMKLIDHKETNTVAIRYDYIHNKTKTPGSAVIGKVYRDHKGSLVLSLNEASKRFGWTPFKRIPLRKIPAKEASPVKRNSL